MKKKRWKKDNRNYFDMNDPAIDYSFFDDAIQRTLAEVVQLWAPPTDMSMVDWAEEFRVLSPENCAMPGPYKVAVTPYLKEILESINDWHIEKVIMQKSSQVGWTEGIVNNAVGYYIDQDPCPMLVLFPTTDMGKRYSKEKLAVMIRDCMRLRFKVAEPKSRDSENTVLSKNFKGGHLELVGSNSPVGLSSSPIRLVIIEEPDRCAANSGGEGSSIKLAIERSKTFFNRKILIGGSPTIKGTSEIEREMALSDKRRFKIPCPHCGAYQILKWSAVIWDKEEGRGHEVYGDHLPETARLRCEHCQETFTNAEKNRMLAEGHWEATAEFNGTAGFYINDLYSPFPKSRLEDIVAKFLEAKRALDVGDPFLMITWTNTVLGETWEEKGEGIENEAIAGRVEAYKKSRIDNGVIVITASIDVQDDRLEYEILGHGLESETWSLDYGAIQGDPELPKVWLKADKILKKTFNRGGIDLRISCAVVDSGAHTNAVYKFVLPRQGRRIYAIKGSSKEGEPLVGRPSKKSLMKGLKLYPVGTDTAKTMIMSRLKIEKPGPGFCHFPDHYPDEYFKQLTAEELVTRYRNGIARRVWKKNRPRNEALDLRVYNLVAFAILNPRLKIIDQKLKAAEEKVKREKKVKENKQSPDVSGPVEKSNNGNEKRRLKSARRRRSFATDF